MFEKELASKENQSQETCHNLRIVCYFGKGRAQEWRIYEKACKKTSTDVSDDYRCDELYGLWNKQ